jgi:hypothetical protein
MIKKLNNKRIMQFFKQLLVNKLENIHAKQALQGGMFINIQIIHKYI